MLCSTRTVLGVVAATSLLAACGASATDAGGEPAPAHGGSRPTSTPETAGAGEPAPAHDGSRPTSTPETAGAAEVRTAEFPAGTGQQIVNHKGAWDLVLRDVRVGEHDGFDRVVVEFEGAGSPGWGAQYVRTPRAEGSGEVVDVRGNHVLGVSISGVTIRKAYPEVAEDFFQGARHFAPENGGEIEDVNLGGVFEGYSQLFVGIDGDKVPFRVFALTNPSRLVVDVKDDQMVATP